MRYFKVSPECAGRCGDNTVFKNQKLPLRITKYEFEWVAWPEDDLFSGMGGGIVVVKSLAEDLKKSSLTGFQIKPVETVEDEQFWL